MKPSINTSFLIFKFTSGKICPIKKRLLNIFIGYVSIVVSTSCVLEDEALTLVSVGMFNSSGSCLNTLKMVLWIYHSFVAADKHAI